jgi:hypothetical protein
MEEVLDQCLSPTTAMITGIVELENAHININHPDFVGGSDSLLNLFQIEGEENQHTLLTGDAKPSIYEGQGTQASSKDTPPKQEEDTGSSWGFTSFMGKKKQSKLKETAQDPDDKMDTQSISVLMQSEINNEQMVKNHVKRVQDEQQAKKQRQDEKSNLISVQMGVNRPALFTFDQSNLPPVILPQIPYKMRPNSHQESARVVMETRIIQNLI